MGRERLANRRGSISFNFEHRGLTYTCTYSRFGDGRPAELFVQNHKTNSAADVDARDAAIILSFALQFGADLVAIAKALSRDPRGSRPPAHREGHQMSGIQFKGYARVPQLKITVTPLAGMPAQAKKNAPAGGDSAALDLERA